MVKSLNSFSNLLSFDLSSYGAALAIINQFCDDDEVKVFEVSPAGSAGLLILLIKDQTAAELLKSEIFSFYKANVLSSALVKNLNLNILKTYLSQNVPEVSSHLLVQEFSFVSDGFRAAEYLLLSGINLVDFRVIRTFPLNVILVSSAKDSEVLRSAKAEVPTRSNVIIEKVEPVLRQYFEINKKG